MPPLRARQAQLVIEVSGSGGRLGFCEAHAVVIREANHRSEGKDLVDQGHHATERSVLLRHVAESLDSPEREANARIGALRLDDIQIVVPVGKKRLGVGWLDVVTLKRTLRLQFLVDIIHSLIRRKHDLTLVQKIRQRLKRARTNRLILGDKHQSTLDLHVANRDEPVCVLVEVWKAMFVRHVFKSSVQTLGQAMVSAAKYSGAT